MSFGQFKLIAETQPPSVPDSHLFKWKSERTGMQVVLIKRQSPSVQASIAVASEANDNSGCPHTLEHIVFMGSEKYPYRGFLDKVSVKQLSSINAYTDQDRTCYTLTSAGYEGFLKTLPVFLDNILHAKVEDSACLTEVYHVDGKGEEKGVVFCEMQGHENTDNTIMSTEMQRLLYTPTSGYATNTGGNLTALRSLKPSTIRQYHKDVYRPDNLLVTVSGGIEPEQLLDVLAKFDSSLPEGIHPFPRPFIESELSNAPSPLKENTYSVVEFPDSSEEFGQILIAWEGPDVRNLISYTALEVIDTYLTLKNAGKLERNFVAVEKDKALASDVYSDVTAYLNALVNIWFSNVPTSLADKASHDIIEYLEKGILDDIDFDLLRESVNHLYDTFVECAENSLSIQGEIAIMDFIYGDDTTFVPWLSISGEYDILKRWTNEQWVEFIKKYVIAPPKVCIFGKPSKALSKKIDKDKKRMRKEIKRSHNIKEEGRKLKEAIKKNDEPVPDELMEQYPVPSFNKIPFISTTHAPSDKLLKAAPWLAKDSKNCLSEIIDPSSISGIAINFEQVKSQFVSIDLFIEPHNISSDLYPLIPAVFSRIFTMPMQLDDGTKLTSDEVIAEINHDLRSSGFYVGGRDELPEFVTLSIGTGIDNYQKALEWLYRILFNVVFTEEDVAVALARDLKSIAEKKRIDSCLLNASMESRMLSDSSLRKKTESLLYEATLRDYEQDIQKAVAEVKTLYKSLFRRENMRISVVADIISLFDKHGKDFIISPWKKISSRLEGSDESPLLPVVNTSHFLTDDAITPPKEAVLTVSAATDSTNMIVTTPGVMSYRDEDLAGLAVISSYLESLEGPLSVAVRGSGLAYGVFISASVQLGNIQCQIYESTDAVAAYDVCKEVIQDIANGKIEITETDVKSAGATLVCNMAAILATPTTSAKEKFMDVVMKEYGVDRVNTIISKISAFTPSEFVRLLKKYILPVFDVDKSMIFVVAPVSEEEHCREGLTKLGYTVTVNEVHFEAESDDDDEEDNSESESHFRSEADSIGDDEEDDTESEFGSEADSIGYDEEDNSESDN